MELPTLNNLADLSTSLKLAEWQLGIMPRSQNRLFGTKVLRRAWSVYRKLTNATLAETSMSELAKQVIDLKAR